MLKVKLVAICLVGWQYLSAQNVGIGTTVPSVSAQLELNSTNKGFLMPRMTTAQRDSIVSPVVGLQVFNLDDHCTDLYDGANWIKTCGLKVVGIATDPSHPDTDSWARKTDFGGVARRGAVGFSIGNKGYLGTGFTGVVGIFNLAVLTNDFWEYDPSNNSWTQKANVGGLPRDGAVGFSIGNRGYVGTGRARVSDIVYENAKDFWEYDPVINTWTKKADFGGAARQGAVGFNIDKKGYIGTGNVGNLANDFWEYDRDTDTWKEKAGFGGTPRSAAVGFSIDGKGYIGTGNDGGLKNDFWEYDPVGNSWVQKANFGGPAIDRGAGFSIGGKGYIGGGFAGFTNTINTIIPEFWEFNPATNTWQKKANFPSSQRHGTTGFSIGSKGFFVAGNAGQTYFSSGFLTNEVWQYMDDNVTGLSYSSNLVPSIGNSVSNGTWTLLNNAIFNANGGNVGIGTSTPSVKLDVTGSIKASGQFIAGNMSAAGIVTNTAGGILASTVVVPVANGGTGSATALTPGSIPFAGPGGIYIQNNSSLFWNNTNVRLGIGTNAPDAPLHINGTGMTTPNLQRSYFLMGSNLGGFNISSSTSGNIQVHANGWYWADGGGFVATSDARIKNIIGRSNGSNDLAILNAIEVTDYKYKDEISHGSGLQKKVIAQQLQSVYPSAVNSNKGIVPGIFEKALKVQSNGNETAITMSKSHNLVAGDIVKLILEKGGEKMVKVNVIDTYSFSVGENIEDNIFVYGKLVNDLLNVDYDAISMLNVSATQELYKKLKKLQQENAAYEARIRDIEAKMNALLKTTAANK